jgi:hypothetical protein
MTNQDFLSKLKKALSYGYVEADFYAIAEDYDLKDSRLDGHREKEFLRIDSEVFKDLIEEIQTNPHTGYITYANKIIKEGYIPKKISSLVKRLEPDSNHHLKVDDPDLTFKESLASQILNLYGCPTAHNITIKDSEIEEDYAFTSVSVDMVSKDMLTLENLGCELSNNLEKNLSIIKNNLILKASKNNISSETIEKYTNKILEDYSYSFLIRKFVLQDGDFYEYNSGILVDEDKLQYVNFDFEHSFFDYYAWPNISKTLHLVKQTFPQVYDNFKLTSAKMYDGLIDLTKHREIDYLNDDHQENVNTLTMNLRTVLLAYRHIEHTSQKEDTM